MLIINPSRRSTPYLTDTVTGTVSAGGMVLGYFGKLALLG
jgi:hypothetical protein